MSPEILLTEDAKGIQKIPVKTFESDIFAFGLVIREVRCRFRTSFSQTLLNRRIHTASK